jgi:hypothetical protein
VATAVAATTVYLVWPAPQHVGGTASGSLHMYLNQPAGSFRTGIPPSPTALFSTSTSRSRRRTCAPVRLCTSRRVRRVDAHRRRTSGRRRPRAMTAMSHARPPTSATRSPWATLTTRGAPRTSSSTRTREHPACPRPSRSCCR